MPTRTLYDIVALIARLGVGMVFAAHGWDKIRDGIDQTAQSFEAMGVPFAEPAAVYSTFVELLGGVTLIAGIGLPVVGILLFLDMAGAFVLVHADNGVFVGGDASGFELVLVLGLTALLFACGGAGRLTVDRALFGRRPARRPAGTGTGTGAGKQQQPARHQRAKKKERADELSDSWVKDLPEEQPFESERPDPASKSGTPSPKLAGEIADPTDDLLVAGKKTGRSRTSGSSTRKSSTTGKTPRTARTSRSSKAKGKQPPG